ncbi:MAG: TolC family protein [Candidatus Sericytochromatia bacterium]|nr:TolC family protein [Candidatus Sericytochromatia bacterium]
MSSLLRLCVGFLCVGWMCLPTYEAIAAIAPSTDILTLELAVKEALRREPLLHQAELDLEQTLVGLEGVKAERLQYGGDVTVGNWAGLTGLMSHNPVQPMNVPIANAQLMARWPVFTGFRLSRQIDAAEAAVRASRARLEQARQDTILAVLESFWGIRRAELKLDVQREATTGARAALRIAKEMIKTGRAPAWEVERAEVAALTAEGEALRLEAEVARARDQLGALLQRDMTGVVLDAAFPGAVTPMNVPAEAAFDRRPDVRLARAELAIKQADVGVASSERWPKLELASLYQYGNNPFFATSGNRSVLDRLVGTFNAQINLSYSLFDHGVVGRNIHARTLECAQSEQALVALLARAEVEVRAARRRLELARRRVSLGTRNEALAKRNLEWLQTRYRFGFVRLVELNESRVNFVASKNQRLDAEIDRYLAMAALYKSLGVLDAPPRAPEGGRK